MSNNVTPPRNQIPRDEATPEQVEEDGEVEEVPVNVEGDHTPVLHTTGVLPAAYGSIPPTFNTENFAEQRRTALEFYTFLRSENPQFLKLNEGTTAYTALVNIPRSKLVKVVFCPGMGSSPIGVAASAIDEKFLFLHGDGSEDIAPPSPLVFPRLVATPAEMNIMTEEQITTSLTTKGVNYTYPLLQRNHITTQETIMRIAPLPPYFVYDGFEGDLDAGLVYERLLQHNDVENEMFSHLKSFLRACLSSHNAGDEKPYVDTTVFASTPAVQARRWAKTKFMGCFPGLHIVTPVKAVASPTTPPTDIAAILAAILPHRVTPPQGAEIIARGR